MKAKKLYKELEKHSRKNGGRMPGEGLCAILSRRQMYYQLNLLIKLFSVGKNGYWGGPRHEFTDLRKNVLLLLAEIEDEEWTEEFVNRQFVSI